LFCKKEAAFENIFFLELRLLVFFFFQAEDGIRDKLVTGVQTCALPICGHSSEEESCQAAAIVARGRCEAFTGIARSTRMNAPSRVLNRKFASTRAPRSASHEAASSPHRRRACASVNRKPGISKNSPWTRRSTSSVARIGSGGIESSVFGRVPGDYKGLSSNRCATGKGELTRRVEGWDLQNQARIATSDRFGRMRAAARRVDGRSLGDGTCRETHH